VRSTPEAERTAGPWRGAGGLVWLLNARNYVDRRHLEPGGYETRQMVTLFSLLERHPPDVFLDVGANFGLYAVTVSARLGCRTRAFEPDARNFAQLQANLLANNLLDRVEPVRKAVAAARGELTLIAASARSTGQTRTTTDPTVAGPRVSATTIDDEVDVDALAGRWFAAKIDVEGAENAVLAGMARLLSRASGVFQVEVLAENAARFEALMAGHGYVPVARIDDDRFFLPRAAADSLGPLGAR
jgi:FkbM family methyltransferase